MCCVSARFGVFWTHIIPRPTSNPLCATSTPTERWVRVLHTESRNILDLKVNGPYDNVSISHLLTFAAAAHTTGEITHAAWERDRNKRQSEKFYMLAARACLFVCSHLSTYVLRSDFIYWYLTLLSHRTHMLELEFCDSWFAFFFVAGKHACQTASLRTLVSIWGMVTYTFTGSHDNFMGLWYTLYFLFWYINCH